MPQPDDWVTISGGNPDDWVDITPKKYENKPSYYDQYLDPIVSTLTRAPDIVTKPIKRFEDWITTPSLTSTDTTKSIPMGKDSFISPQERDIAGAQLKGFIGGSAVGLGNQLSPANVAQQAFPESKLINYGVTGLQGLSGVKNLAQGNYLDAGQDLGWAVINHLLGPNANGRGGDNRPPLNMSVEDMGPVPSGPSPQFRRQLEGRVEPVNTPPPSQPGPPPGGVGHRIIRDDWTPAMMEHYKQMGYVPGGIDPISGNAYMEFKGTQQPTQQAPSQEQPSNPFDQVPVEEDSTGETVKLNKPSNTAIENLKAEGFKLVEIDRSGIATFKRLFTDESGEVDFGALKAGLRRMLGREPTEEEVQRKAFEENSHISVEPGVQTGRVAPFTPKDEFISGGVHRPSEISPEVWNTLDDYQKSQYLRDKEELDYGYPTIRPSLEQWNRPGTTQPSVQEPQVHEIPLKMAYNMPEEIRPIGDTPVGQLIQNVQPTGDPQLDTQINRMKEIVSSPRMSNDLWEELRTLGYTVSRNPNMSPDFRRNWSQSSSAPQGPQLGPRVVPPPVQFKEPEIDPNINVTNPIDQLRGQNQLQNISQAQPSPVDLGPRPTQESFGPPTEEPLISEMGAPRRPFKSDPNRMDLGPRYYGQGRPSIAGDLVQARDSQNERARALGIDPKGMSDDELVNAIRRARGLTDEEPIISEMSQSDEFVRMEIGNREDILRNMIGQYAENGARVANKELLQNAIDALTNPDGTGKPGAKVEVNLEYNRAGKGPHIVVSDNGPGLPIDLIKNEYVTLTGSGKRGQGKFIGEMGVGKATYLLGTDSFEVSTVAKEPDGSTWKYDFAGTPEDMITGRIKIAKQQMTNGTPTGTKVIVYDKEVKNLEEAERYLNTFSTYSNSPVEVQMKGNRYTHNPQYANSTYMQSLNLNKTVQPRSPGPMTLVDSGSVPGANFAMYVPDSVSWKDNQNSISVVLNNRGMFQGVDNVYLSGSGKIPDHVVVEIEPTVPATDSKNYPLTSPTRERMKPALKEAVKVMVDDKIMKEAKKKASADIQQAVDELIPVPNPRNPTSMLSFVTHDSGGRYTQQELDNFNGSPIVQETARIMGQMLSRLSALFPTEQLGKTVRHGFIIDNKEAGGINIVDPRTNSTPNREFSIMVNFPGLIEQSGGNPARAGEMIAHAILHEFTHNLVRQEGDQFTWAFLLTDSRFGTGARNVIAKQIGQLISDGQGGFNSELQTLLDEYNAARGRPDTKVDLIKRSQEGRFLAQSNSQEGISGSGESTREGINPFVSNMTRRGGGFDPNTPSGTPLYHSAHYRINEEGPSKQSKLREAYNLSRGITTTMDLSAPLRQGLPLIGTRAWWTSWNQQMRALGSEEAYNKTIADIKARPMFRRYRDSRTGKEIKSFAEQAGLALTDVSTNLNQREESIASSWTESGKMFGENNAVQRGYKATIGRGARASNRAYTAYLNQLRADTFETLIKSAKASFDSSSAAGTLTKTGDKDPLIDMTYAREIASVVNTLTGRGSLTLVGPSMEGGKLHLKEHSAEAAAGLLTNTMFAPRNTAAKMQMMNPMTYMMASPFVRKQYLKGLLGVAGAWLTVSGLASLAGADVTLDLRSADFGKVKIGNFRLDPGGGFQQFLVDYARNATGHTLSSASGKNFELGQGYRAPTRKDINEGFWVNKLHPMIKFAYDIFDASTHQSFGVMDRTLQQVVPLVIQDLWDIVKENPELLPFSPAIIAGMGTQIYNKGQTEERFIPKEYDYNFTGGELPGSSLFQ